jgi:hypothetical protein
MVARRRRRVKRAREGTVPDVPSSGWWAVARGPPGQAIPASARGDTVDPAAAGHRGPCRKSQPERSRQRRAAGEPGVLIRSTAKWQRTRAVALRRDRHSCTSLRARAANGSRSTTSSHRGWRRSLRRSQPRHALPSLPPHPASRDRGRREATFRVDIAAATWSRGTCRGCRARDATELASGHKLSAG